MAGGDDHRRHQGGRSRHPAPDDGATHHDAADDRATDDRAADDRATHHDAADDRAVHGGRLVTGATGESASAGSASPGSASPGSSSTGSTRPSGPSSGSQLALTGRDTVDEAGIAILLLGLGLLCIGLTRRRRLQLADGDDGV